MINNTQVIHKIQLAIYKMDKFQPQYNKTKHEIYDVCKTEFAS